MSKIREKLSENRCIYQLWNRAYVFKLKTIANIKGLNKVRYDDIVSFDSMNSVFYLPWYKTDLIQQSILVYEKYYEQDYLNKYILENFEGKVAEYIRGKTVLDIGSNIGNHSLFLKKEIGCGKIYAFEPVKATFEVLKKNMEINCIYDCKLFNMGCGSEDNFRAKLRSFDCKNSGGATLITDNSGDIEMVTIDSLNIQDEVAFVKIDTEGFEKEVINGAIKTISRDKPFLMVEIAKKNFDELISQLSSMGYKYEKYDKENVFFYDPIKVK